MNQHSLIAIDLAKNVFHVCGMNEHRKIFVNKALQRNELAAFIAQQPATEIVMEACYSSHYWARCFMAMGHSATLLPAQHVKPFVRGNKSDRNDALAIAEAAQRPGIRPVPVKTVEQQDIQALHRLRSRYVSARTGLVNQTRGLLSEYGLVAARGNKAFLKLLQAADEPSTPVTPLLKAQLGCVRDEYQQLTNRIDELTALLARIAKQHPLCQRLVSVPGIGIINATALYSAIGNGNQFRNGRELAVWLGLTPRQSSSGERMTSGGITRRGNRYLRKQLIHGARAAISRCAGKDDALSRWATQLAARRGRNKACVALASRMARIVWVLLQRQEAYDPAKLVASM